MKYGVDYAWGVVPYDALVADGVQFVMRYVSHDSGKDLSVAEKAELWKRGISVGLVFESTANRALDGFNAGATDATWAKARCDNLGLGDIPVYFATDWDVTEAQKPIVANYLKGAASVIGKERVGVYGGFYVVRYMSDNGVCSWFWQTYAWSGGQLHPAAHIYQWQNGVRIGGLSCDRNKGLKDDIGVRGPKSPKPVPPAPTPTPTPAPAPTPPATPTIDVLNQTIDQADKLRGLKGYWAWVNWSTGEGDWRQWGKANHRVRPAVPKTVAGKWWTALRDFLAARRP